MRRSFKKVLSDGMKLFIKDIKSAKWVIIFVIAYFAFLRNMIFSMCPMVMITGYPCPSCGMTRAGIRLLHLDFEGAWEIHPFIYGVVLLCMEPLYSSSSDAEVSFVARGDHADCTGWVLCVSSEKIFPG